jgi:cytochrome oxidase Cu insertion factor (SCO1/SenC/PrrC family)
MSRPAARPGPAVIALLAIVLITAGWWALALWPAGGEQVPAWLVRTRAACFGAVAGGLPDTAGWIVLIGQPIGLFGFLFAAWGDVLRRELRQLRAERRWRLAGSGLVLLALVGVAAAARRVAQPARGAPPGSLAPVALDASGISLTDQFGRRTSFAELGGGAREGALLLTFGFGHCQTFCPTLVQDLLSARIQANRPQVPLVVVMLDPWRDTPARLGELAARWKLGPRDRLLTGTVAEVEQALDRLGIGRHRNEATGDIEHGAIVMLLDGRGRVVRRLDAGWGRVMELLAAIP